MGGFSAPYLIRSSPSGRGDLVELSVGLGASVNFRPFALPYVRPWAAGSGAGYEFHCSRPSAQGPKGLGPVPFGVRKKAVYIGPFGATTRWALRPFFMKKPILSVLAATILVLAGPTAAFTGTERAGERAHPAILAAIQPWAPRVRVVNCSEQLLGYAVTFPLSGEIWLNQYLCNPLEQLIRGQLNLPKRQGAAAITLVHEAIHTMAPISEAHTECLAYQSVDNVLRLWKVPKWVQNPVLQGAYKDHFNLVNAIKQYRNTTKCRPNGAWDTTPGDGIWP